MAHDHRSDDQESLFPTEHTDDRNGSAETGSPPPDLSSEEERLRNGDISFRPVSLPGADPDPAVNRSGTAGTALMIVAAIVVVFLLTYVIYTFYEPSPDGAEETAVTEPVESSVPPGDSDGREAPAEEEPAAIFQAHAELQENYRQSEKRITELEAELEKLRNASPVSAPAGGSPADQERLARLEQENRTLKTDLQQQRQESESAISRAERLVERAEAQVAEERDRSRTARQEAEALAGEKSAIADELDALNTRVAELETEVARRKEAYDRLTANTSTRLEGESEAVRQLISRHAEELEQERQKTREKEAEILRLKTLIARLSVTDPGSGNQTRTAGSSPSSTSDATASATGSVSPPRILTRKEPEYPVNARRLRVEGTVLLNVLVGTDGRVREVKVLEAEGGKLLSPAAVDAVRQWTFSPATREGQPVDCWHKVPIRFAL